MSWNNYGSYWEIDHVKPIASFDLTKEAEIHEAFDWKNTRPMEKASNTSKGDTIDWKVINSHRDVVEEFLARTVMEECEIGDNNRYSYYTIRLCGGKKSDYEEVIEI